MPDFAVAAFLAGAFFVAAALPVDFDGAAVLLVTRPDLVLPRTTSFFSTAGAFI